MISLDSVRKKIRHIQLMDDEKVGNLYQELLNIPQEGELAEIGVYRGCTSLMMRLMYPDRVLHCYDTFCGIVGADPTKDVHKDGEFSCSLEDVQRDVGTENTFYHVGFFPESFNERDRRFAFVHSDTDTYVGTKSTIEEIFPLLVPGGILVFDDYNWGPCPGVKAAIDAWNAPEGLKSREYRYQKAFTK